MKKDYPVEYSGQTVGRVQLLRQGLYYLLTCRCKAGKDVMFCLEAVGQEKTVHLGILVPMNDGFGLDTRIAASKLEDEALTFRLVPRHDSMSGKKFVPIRAEEPFAYLSELKNSFLEIRGTQKGIVIPQKNSEPEK